MFHFGCTYGHFFGPDGSVSEGVPHDEITVIPTCHKLVLIRVGSQAPQLIHVTLKHTTPL